jgi:hypothetical protein
VALTPAIRAAQFAARAVTSGVASVVSAASFVMRSIITFPTPFVEAAQLFARSIIKPHAVVQVPSFLVRAITFSWPGNPKVRAWGYSQDGHDFYVLHLGAQGTIVYDATTGSWSSWDSLGRNTWRAGYGLDWLGMAKDNYAGGAVTQVVAGDENLGVLWTLDPTSGVDDDPVNPDSEHPFTRAVRGGFPITERNNIPCNAVWLRISTGRPVYTDTTIRLRFSDDQGMTWYDAGTVAVNALEFGQVIYWRSLGLIRPPLRIFEFSDVGAMVRIDGADVDAS